MAGQMANEGKEKALNFLFRDQDSPLGTVYVGLAYIPISSSDSLGDVYEETDTAYERQEITFGEPQENGDEVSIENTNTVQFPPFDEANNDISWAFITDVADGTGGLLLATIELDETKIVNVGDMLEIQPGEFKIILKGAE